jgi:serine/threonine protein kinase
MIEPLTTLGLLSAFGINVASAAAFEWIAAKWRTAGVTNHDLQKALRESYCDALSSIEFGFHRQEGLLDSLGKRRLYREITSNFDKEFLTPFISDKTLSKDELESLTREGATYCRILREAVDELLPKEDIPTITIEDLLLVGRKLEGAEDLRKLNNKAKADLMSKVRSLEGIPKFFFDFLEYKDLLIGSLVFFYGEKIKTNERVRSIFTHAELQRIREEQSQQYQKQAAKMDKALQLQMSAFQQFLSPIKDNFAEVLTYLDRLEAEWADTNKYLQRILDLITVDKGLSPKDKKQLEAGLSPSFDLHAKYEFDERKPIGYGAVAIVYRAMHRGLRQVRAVKVLKPEHKENQEVVERFLREAVVLGSLKHPNIVQIYDAGGGGPGLDFYLEMEYVEGVTLRNFIKTHEFDWQRILKFIKQLGSAIQKMHDSNIIHRDLNPRNIMVDKNGDLKVMDFGVAKIIGVEGLTKDGQVVGTTDYMAPEQARGERVDERVDIYSFGVILYELFTRRLPSVPPVPIRQYQPNVPELLEGIVDKCLKQDKNMRYANISEVITCLDEQQLEGIRKAEIKKLPLLGIDCERLDFTNVKTGVRSTKSFTIQNTGGGRLTGRIATSHSWLEILPDSVDVGEGQIYKISVTVDTTGLASGYVSVGDVSIITSGGSAKIKVRLSTAMAARAKWIAVPTIGRKKWLTNLTIGTFAVVGVLTILCLVPLKNVPIEATETYYDTEVQKEPYVTTETTQVPETNESYVVKDQVTTVSAQTWYSQELNHPTAPANVTNYTLQISGIWDSSAKSLLDYGVQILDSLNYQKMKQGAKLTEYDAIGEGWGVPYFGIITVDSLKYPDIYVVFYNLTQLDHSITWSVHQTITTAVSKQQEVTKYRDVPVQVEKQRTVTTYQKESLWQYLFH